MKSAKRYIQSVLFYEALIALFAIYIVFKSHSTAAIFPMMFAIVGVIAVSFMLYIICIAEKGDVNRYPYGTGRLENASSFFFALLLSVGTCLPLFKVINDFFSETYHAPELGWTTLLLFLTTTGQAFLSFKGKGLNKKTPSPILATISEAYRISTLRDFITFALLFVFLIFGRSNKSLMFWVDQICAITLGVYAIKCYIPSIWTNLCSLVDFPLSENEQIKVMGLLSRYFDEYDMLGNIYSTNKGSKQIVEIELEFNENMRMAEFLDIEERMNCDFQNIFPGGTLRILPNIIEA